MDRKIFDGYAFISELHHFCPLLQLDFFFYLCYFIHSYQLQLGFFVTSSLVYLVFVGEGGRLFGGDVFTDFFSVGLIFEIRAKKVREIIPNRSNESIDFLSTEVEIVLRYLLTNSENL